MQPITQPRKLTYEDFLGFPEDGRRHELIDGEHVVTPSPRTKHQRISMALGTRLHQHVREHGLGQVLAAPMDVVLSDVDVVEPDLIFVSNDRAGIVGEVNLGGAPDLLVEILSESTRRRDEITKRHLYERFGVREYWVVDPVLDSIKVHRPGDDGTFRRAAELTLEAGDTLTSPLLPGLELPLAEIFPP